MKKIIKILIILIVAGGIGASVFMRLTKEEEAIEAVPDPAVQIENPVTGTIELSTGLTGTIEPSDVVYVIPKGAGEVIEVYAKQGEQVEEGQALYKIDNKQLDAARISLDTVAVSLRDAETNLARMQILYNSGDISAQAYEQVVSSVSMARLQYKSAKLNYDIQLENSTVTAPIAGLLEQFDVEVHDMVSSASGFTGVISGAGSKSVSFAVTERVAAGLSLGMSLQVEKNGSEYTGVITEVGTMVDQMTGLFKVKAALEGADGLAAGTMVKLYVTAQKAENVMTIPVDCVTYIGGEAFVYTYDEAAGIVHRVKIEDGLIDSEKLEVVSGLSYSDQVVTTWTKEIYEGAPVRVLDADAAAGIPSGETAPENNGSEKNTEAAAQ